MMFLNSILYVLISLAYLLLTLEQFAMLARALLSIFSPDGDSHIAMFLYYVTEPVILPVRKLLSHFPSLDDLPIDISFSVAFFMLILLEYLLPAVKF